MKTFKIVALGAVAALGISFTSCGGGVSTDAAIVTQTDSLSYALGLNMYDQGILGQLQNNGLISDTSRVSQHYQTLILTEKDDAKRNKLVSERKHQLDSITQRNEKNLSAFFKGFQEGYASTELQEAHTMGVLLGTRLSKQDLPQIVAAIYGEEEAKATKDPLDKISKNHIFSAMLTRMKGKKGMIENPNEYLSKVVEDIRENKALGQYEELKVAGEKFLAENKAKEGVVTLPNGLQYKVIKEGTGAKPAITDKVSVHYEGRLIDGTVFDSSYKRNEPASFPLTGVIKGWTEALQLMPVGSKWELYIPYDLAYGTADMGEIKPFSTLVFDVELLEIVK